MNSASEPNGSSIKLVINAGYGLNLLFHGGLLFRLLTEDLPKQLLILACFNVFFLFIDYYMTNKYYLEYKAKGKLFFTLNVTYFLVLALLVWPTWLSVPEHIHPAYPLLIATLAVIDTLYCYLILRQTRQSLAWKDRASLFSSIWGADYAGVLLNGFLYVMVLTGIMETVVTVGIAVWIAFFVGEALGIFCRAHSEKVFVSGSSAS